MSKRVKTLLFNTAELSQTQDVEKLIEERINDSLVHYEDHYILTDIKQSVTAERNKKETDSFVVILVTLIFQKI